MIHRLLSPNGRAGREEWWTVTVLVGLAKLCIMFAATPLAALTGDVGSSAWQWCIWILLAALDLMLLWPLIALNLRRAHDRDAGGEFEVAILFAAVVASLAVDNTPWDEERLGWVANLLRALVYGGPIVLALNQGLVPGRAGDNRYGPPAKALPRPAP